MFTKRAAIISGLALMTLMGLIVLDRTEVFAYIRLRNLYRDAVSRAGRTTVANPDLVFLAIDAATVSLDETDIVDVFGLADQKSDAVRALQIMAKRWPWSRDVYALVLDRLFQAGARVVALDLTFPGPTNEDASFRRALDRYHDRVVIGSNFVDGSLTRPCETLVPQTAPIDGRIGYTNFWADDDDVVRRARYRVTFEQVRETTPKAGSEEFLSFAANIVTKAGFARDLPSLANDRLLRFTAPPRRGFPPHSLFEIFVPAYWEQNYQSGEFFRNKIVIVGADGNWQHDEHPTPFGLMPGAELHLNAINAALHHEFVRELPASATALITGLVGVLAVVLTLLLRSPWVRLLALLALSTGLVLCALVFYNYASVFIPVVAPLAQLSVTMLLGLVSDFTSERLEKARVRRALERYVSQNVVCEMLANPKSFSQSLGGVLKPATILFSDIRDFSSVTARTDPQTLVRQLNQYLTAMVECVFRFGGTLDKFGGDAVMAVWGNLRSAGIREDAANAVRTAMAMQLEIIRLNEIWRAEGLSELRVGIAIHHGEVVVGNIGSPHRMEFTVIGDAVNLSWKLQESTKQLEADLVVSEAVRGLVIEHFEMPFCGNVELPSVKGSIPLFSVRGPVEVDSVEAAIFQ